MPENVSFSSLSGRLEDRQEDRLLGRLQFRVNKVVRRILPFGSERSEYVPQRIGSNVSRRHNQLFIEQLRYLAIGTGPFVTAGIG